MDTLPPPSWQEHLRAWLLRPRAGGLAGAVLLSGLASLVDYATGADAAATLFHLLPVAYAAFRVGRGAGMAIALLSAASWLTVTLLSGAHQHHPLLVGWNFLVQAVIFVGSVALLDLLRQHLEAEAREKHLAVEQLRHADRLNTVGKLAAGLAHELGTPLNVISGRAELLQGGLLGPDDARRSLEVILDQTQKMSGILRQLLDFARRGGSHKTRVSLGDLAQQTADLLRTMAQKRGITLVVEPTSGPTFVMANAAEMQQVLTNLTVNAIHASPPRQAIRLCLGRATASDGGTDVFMQIEDQGAGIAPEHLPHIFDPFFTTKPVGEGTGLGLSVSYGIVRDHGGQIEVQSAAGAGSRFRVRLPAA